MSDDAQNPYLLYPDREVQKRVRYYDGQFLGSADFILAQTHGIDRHRRHLANTVTPGVLDGYAVHGELDGVVIGPGTAVDALGRPMVLTVNARRAIQATDRSKNLTLWARYQEQASDDSAIDQGAAGLVRFDETPELTYTPDGTALPDAVLVLARLQVDGEGNVVVDTTVRPRAGLKVPGTIPLSLTTHDADPGRGTLSGAVRITVPEGTAHAAEQPALDVRGHARVRSGLIVGQDEAAGYKGVTTDVNDLVVNGQFAAGGSAGSAIFKLGVGYAPPSQGEGTLLAQRIGINTTDLAGKSLHVDGQARFERYTEFEDTIRVENTAQFVGGLDLRAGRHGGDAAAGQIRYQGYSDGLDIIGAGNAGLERKITFHAQGGSRHVGDLRVEDDIVATRDVNPGRNLQAGQDVTAGRNAVITGRTTTQTLTVNGTSTLTGVTANSVTVAANLESRWLRINETANVDGNLNVTGISNLNGAVNINGGAFNVAPVADFGARVNVNGDLLQVTNRLMPSVGSDNTKGIVWPGQSNNDVGAIRFWKEGNNTRLVIDNQNNADDVIVLRQKDGDRLTVQNGRVGINHATPSTDLHVGGGAQVDGALTVDGTLTAGGRLIPSAGGGDNGIVWQYNAFGGSGDAAKIQYTQWGGTEDTALVLETTNDANDIIVLKQSGGDRLTVKGGKVGINEADPAYSLDVSGTLRATGNVRVDGYLDFAAGDANRNVNGGTIKHKVHSNDALEILGGGGPDGSQRRVRMWAENGLIVSGWGQFSGHLTLHNSSNNRAVVSHATNTRVIWGAVKSNGTKWCGDGFTCERYGGHTGVFKISFNPDFQSRPAIVVTQHYPNDVDNSNDWGNTRDNAIVARTDKAWAIIVTGNGDGSRTYRSFEFIAVGRVN